MAEAQPVVLEILKKLQAGQSRLEARVEALMAMQEDIRMIRAAVNDIAAVNVTSGEIGAIHHDLNRLQQRIIELDGRLHRLEEA
jgi:hypothetical protein